MKTLSQLAEQLNVSKSTIYRTIHKNGFRTIQQGNKKLVDESTEKAIIRDLQGKSIQAEQFRNDSGTIQDESIQKAIIRDLQGKSIQAEQFRNDSGTIQNSSEQFMSKEAETKIIDVLQSTIEILKNQLAEKDKQIFVLSEQVTNLTTTLNQQQALHAGTIQSMLMQQQPSEVGYVKEQLTPDTEKHTSEDQTPTQEKKSSFFARLFKMSKRN